MSVPLCSIAGLGGTYSWASGINASGQVAGWSSTAGNATQAAVVWNETTPTVLGSFGGTASEAYGINDSGQVVGMSSTPDFASSHPFLYTGGTIYNPNNLLVSNPGVTDIGISPNGNSINDSGAIAAYGTYGGQQVALVLPPHARAHQRALLLSGTALLALRRRRTAL
ncbi:MAG: hypothetical protein K8R23_15015 [Chthoniobacter sp.]|nr:hypothetical protein [Chthoniobacter sp.]